MFKIVRNSLGEVVCFGPNMDEYQPIIPEGCALSIEEVLPAKSPSEIQEETNVTARAYLLSTDWYVVRFAETQTPIPADILADRAKARLDIV